MEEGEILAKEVQEHDFEMSPISKKER